MLKTHITRAIRVIAILWIGGASVRADVVRYAGPSEGDGLVAWQENDPTDPNLVLPGNDGTWTDGTNVNVSWTDATRWQDEIIAYGSDRTAFFDTLNHAVSKVVDLSSDIVIGTVRYRDNGGVNRDMTLRSANAGRLVMTATNSTPRIWARNRSIHVDVVIDGTNGLELASDHGDRGVVLYQRNRYTGVTTIVDGPGRAQLKYPGDFGDSDVLVQGNLDDEEPELIIEHSQALKASASLKVDTGARVNLAYDSLFPGQADGADLHVARLILGRAVQPEGIYSASTHPVFFTGTGEVVVQPVRTGFPLWWRGTNELSWSSQFGKLYDVCETSDLASVVWTNRETVSATVPTNTYELGGSIQPTGFYKVLERADYLPAVRAGVIARLDGFIGNNYLVDQNLTPGDIRHGQFHNSDNMRMSECTPVLVWAYIQPDSQYYQDTNALNAAIWSIDHMCRAQGINGGFNEYHGWCGVPDRSNGKSSVVGFTLHALGNAITLMAGLDEMTHATDGLLFEYMDPNGTGSNDTQRVVAWKNMLSAAMPFQFDGSGRGHAPNQDLCALMGVYAVNEAHAALDGGTRLKAQRQIDELANEIYYGYPSSAASRPNGQWFSTQGVIGEHGHEDYGYDGNYGVQVSVRYLGVLAPWDATSASFLSTTYAESLQYFFVPDAAAPLGVFAENGISRRSTGDPLAPGMSSLGVARGYHPSLDRLYDITLPYFAAAPAANMKFSSPHMFQIGVWGYCEWLDVLAEPENVDYRLPAEQNAAWTFRDDTMKVLVTKPQGGVPTYYTEIWDTPEKARRHVYSEAAETIDTVGEFP